MWFTFSPSRQKNLSSALILPRVVKAVEYMSTLKSVFFLLQPKFNLKAPTVRGVQWMLYWYMKIRYGSPLNFTLVCFLIAFKADETSHVLQCYFATFWMNWLSAPVQIQSTDSHIFNIRIRKSFSLALTATRSHLITSQPPNHTEMTTAIISVAVVTCGIKNFPAAQNSSNLDLFCHITDCFTRKVKHGTLTSGVKGMEIMEMEDSEQCIYGMSL